MRRRDRTRAPPGRAPWWLDGRCLLLRAGQRVVKAHARGDAELGEHLAEVPFDRTRAEEQPGADLRVGEAVACQTGDLVLLRREVVARLDGALAHLLPRCQELAAGALGER